MAFPSRSASFLCFSMMCLFLLFSKIFLYFAVSGLSCGLRDLSLQNADSLTTDSLTTACGLSCSTAWGILVPGRRIESTSSVLRSRFLTPGPPEKLPPWGALSACLNADDTAWVPLSCLYSFHGASWGWGRASVSFSSWNIRGTQCLFNRRKQSDCNLSFLGLSPQSMVC